MSDKELIVIIGVDGASLVVGKGGETRISKSGSSQIDASEMLKKKKKSAEKFEFPQTSASKYQYIQM